MDEQEFYDSLFNEFSDSDHRGTFTSWLVAKMGVINVYIERLRVELSQARRAQGVPQELYRALEMDNQMLRDQLQDERGRRTLAPAIGQPRTAPDPGVTDPNPWRPATDPNTPWTTNQGNTYPSPLRRPDAMGEPERIDALRERIRQIQADAQDRDRGEP